MICASTRDDKPCVRVTPHADHEQHRDTDGRRWYYGDDMQRGMPRRYIYDNTPLVDLVNREMIDRGRVRGDR
jgi:hypothetical protein